MKIFDLLIIGYNLFIGFSNEHKCFYMMKFSNLNSLDKCYHCKIENLCRARNPSDRIKVITNSHNPGTPEITDCMEVNRIQISLFITSFISKSRRNNTNKSWMRLKVKG